MMASTTTIKSGDIVRPIEGTTWAGASRGRVMDVFCEAGGEKMAEVRWDNGTIGAWPISQLVKLEVA